jgi:hypothetical protein
MHRNTFIAKKIKIVYVNILDNIAIAIGEAGISGYMVFILKHRKYLQ